MLLSGGRNPKVPPTLHMKSWFYRFCLVSTATVEVRLHRTTFQVNYNFAVAMLYRYTIITYRTASLCFTLYFTV